MSRVPTRIRWRRRLLLMSALPGFAVLALAVALISAVVVGDSARENFAAGDIEGLRRDVAVLQTLDIVERAATHTAAGGLAVLEDRLDDADTEFSAALDDTDAAQSCPARINLVLVRERRGDVDAWEARPEVARQRYQSALALIAEAPGGCFAGNSDVDPQRRAVRADAAQRLQAKIDGLTTATPPAAPPPPPPPDGASTPPPPPVADPDAPSDRRQLDLGGDPLEALRQILRDAAA